MSLKKCGIIFSNHSSNVFYNGQIVSGFVNLSLDKKKKCQAFILKVIGEASCQWTETSGKGDTRRPTEFTSKEIYFDFKVNLIPSSFSNEITELKAGSHDFNFSFTLPQSLPSSFEGPFGYVRYTAQVVFKQQNKKDLQYKVSFMVLANSDLNFMPNMRTPIKHMAYKDFHFLMKNMGYIKGHFEIPTSGFVSGENLQVRCNLENKSKVKIEEVKFSLVKIVTFKTSCPFNNQKEEIDTIARCKSIGVEKEEDKFIFSYLSIPSTPPSSFMSCSIIEVKYELKVNLVASGVHGNLKFSIPIIIGTLPLSRDVPALSSREPDAPPPYNDIAFPVYEEATVEKRMKEDFEEWDHSPNFTPRYPVYRSRDSERTESQLPPATSPSMMDNLLDPIKKSDIYKSITKNG